jgi:hypothetical protein
MKKVLYLLPVLGLLLAGCVTTQTAHSGHGIMGPAYAPAVNWHTLEEGQRIAALERKPMIIDFAVPKDCSRCAFLQNNVYNRDEIVSKINADFVPIWINLTKKLTPEERALGESFNFEDDCLLLFCDADGNIIKDPEGVQMCFADKIEPEVFVNYLDYVRNNYVPG